MNNLHTKYEHLQPSHTELIEYLIHTCEANRLRWHFITDAAAADEMEGRIRALELAFRFALFGDREREIDPLDYAPLRKLWKNSQEALRKAGIDPPPIGEVAMERDMTVEDLMQEIADGHYPDLWGLEDDRPIAETMEEQPS